MLLIFVAKPHPFNLPHIPSPMIITIPPSPWGLDETLLNLPQKQLTTEINFNAVQMRIATVRITIQPKLYTEYCNSTVKCQLKCGLTA